MKEKLKKIDIFTIVVMTILFAIILGCVSSITMYIVFDQTDIGNILLSQASAVLILLVVLVYAAIPMLLGFLFTTIMVIIRYVLLDKPKRTRIIKTVVICFVTFILLFTSVYIFMRYVLSNTYEIKINQRVSKIQNIYLRDVISEKLQKYAGYENYKIQKVIFQSSFPDDFDIEIYYINENNMYQVARGFMSDEYGLELKEIAQNLTGFYKLIDKILFVLTIIMLIFAYVYLLIEYINMSKLNLNIDKQKLITKRKYIKRTMFLLGGLAVTGIIIVMTYRYIEIHARDEAMKTISNNSTAIEKMYEGKVFYQKKFDEKNQIRTVYRGCSLGQKTGIGIEKTTDGGMTWEEQSVQVINKDTEYDFIDANVGFINDPGLVGTGGDNRGFYVTVDGGKNFQEAELIHPDNIEEKNLLVDGLPYIEGNLLKLNVYTINHAKEPEVTDYIFYSEDNGLTWEYEKEVE